MRGTRVLSPARLPAASAGLGAAPTPSLDAGGRAAQWRLIERAQRDIVRALTPLERLRAEGRRTRRIERYERLTGEQVACCDRCGRPWRRPGSQSRRDSAGRRVCRVGCGGFPIEVRLPAKWGMP